MRSPPTFAMTDWQHTAATTRDAAIAERTASWIDTQTVATHVCVRRCLSGNVLWTLWKIDDVAGTTCYVGCDELTANRIGWSYRSFRENNSLTHVSCPLAFLDDAPVVSVTWRRAVAAHWRGAAEPLLEISSQAQEWRAGDRVRYEGPKTATLASGLLGVIANAPGFTHIHPDALKRTTYVRWDSGRAEAVFNIYLQR